MDTIITPHVIKGYSRNDTIIIPADTSCDTVFYPRELIWDKKQNVYVHKGIIRTDTIYDTVYYDKKIKAYARIKKR